MFFLWESRDGSPVIVAGPCWPFCTFVTIPLICGLSGLVAYFLIFKDGAVLPFWFAFIYLPVVAITLISLFGVSCRDPGLLPRVTDEEAGQVGWVWNEQVGSFRPQDALYCRECKVSFSLWSSNRVSYYVLLVDNVDRLTARFMSALFSRAPMRASLTHFYENIFIFLSWFITCCPLCRLWFRILIISVPGLVQESGKEIWVVSNLLSSALISYVI